MRWFETNGNTKARTSHGMSWIAEIAMVGGLALLINTIAAQAFYVPSGSMEPTLLISASARRRRRGCSAGCPSAATSSCSACRAIRARPTSSA
jgi:hypothetical protein